MALRGKRVNMRRLIRRSKAKARKGKRRNQLTTVNRSLQPFPNRYICKQKYSTTISTNAGGQYVFNLNSLWDPDRTGIGHQPYGFDNLALLYNRYRVISCGWRVHNATGATGSPIITASLPNNDLGMVFVNTGEMLENPRTKYVVNNPGGPILTLHGKSYIPKLMGRTKTQYMADDNYQSLVTTSPNELALLYLQTFNGFSGDSVGGIGLTVILEFTVEYFDLKHVIQS